MSNFTHAAYNPSEKVVRAADFMDDYFGPHQYGVRFPDDPAVYRDYETRIPLDKVFVLKESPVE